MKYLNSPIEGIENRSAQEVFDIMVHRIKAAKPVAFRRGNGPWMDYNKRKGFSLLGETGIKGISVQYAYSLEDIGK